MPERFVAIGHIAEDIAEPENVIGGGVSYSGIMARELGFSVNIVTKLPPTHRFLDSFAQRGINVFTLPTQRDKITTFTNRYDASGNRRQVLSSRQEPITRVDLSSIPRSELDAACILVAPVIGEVDMNAIPLLADRHGLVAVTPQGYFRETSEDGTIFQKEWQGFEDDLSHAKVAIFSDEDITINGVLNESMFYRLTDIVPTVVLTTGENGGMVFRNGRRAFSINPFPLAHDEKKDFTGAGDVFAVSYLTKYIKSRDHHEAAIFAALVAAIKISGIAGKGVDSIPNRQQIVEFMEGHTVQLREFLKRNDASESALDF